MSSKIRTFLAIELDSSLVDNVEIIQKELKKTKAKIKYVEKENLHFTLKFFGEIDEKTIEEISTGVNEVIKDFDPITIDINGTGSFPDEDHIKTIWIGIDTNPELIKLQKNLDEKFKVLGFKKEKEYVAHLTVGRMKNPKNKRHVKEIITGFKNFEIGPMTINRLSLKQSELTPEGSIYSDISTFDL
jgi:2'-5' RNA ligase